MKYTVIVTEDKKGQFCAIAPNWPNCHVQAHTRNEALQAIRETITQVVTRSERFQLELPIEPKSDEIKQETPWQWFGAFKNDPTWGELFDEIELKRNT